MTDRKISCNAKIDLETRMHSISIAALYFVTLLLFGQMNYAQSAFPVGLPARAPGYEHYYTSEQASSVFATRWGYFDGYQDGKHDREFGKNPAPMDQDRFKLVPDHGTHPEITRAKYKSLYREAYLHGYDYGLKF
jgi:hypothetical protein